MPEDYLNLPESFIAEFQTIDLAAPPYIWEYEGDDGTTFSDPNPNLEPYIEFDPADNYESKYPRLTELVKNLKNFVKNNPKVLNALQKWSGLSKQQILEKLVFRQGNGPKVKIESMYDRYGWYNHDTSPGILHIENTVVNGLENSVLKSTKEATAFLISAVILHEFCHFGVYSSNLQNTGEFKFTEEGNAFEVMAFGVILTTANAGNFYLDFIKK